jgi:hypothetical protein
MEVAEQRLPVGDPLRGPARDLVPEQPDPPFARVAEHEAGAVRQPQHQVGRGVVEAIASEQLVEGRKHGRHTGRRSREQGDDGSRGSRPHLRDRHEEPPVEALPR